MKFFIKSLPVVLVAFMFNCHKTETNNNSILAGTWTRSFTTYSGCKDAGNNTTVEHVCPVTDTSGSCDKYTYNSNGTFKIESSYSNGSNYTVNGTYSIHGNQATGTVNGYTNTVTFTVSADKKTLTTTYTDSSSGCLVTDIYNK